MEPKLFLAAGAGTRAVIDYYGSGAKIIFLLSILLYSVYCRQFEGCQDKKTNFKPQLTVIFCETTFVVRINVVKTTNFPFFKRQGRAGAGAKIMKEWTRNRSWSRN